MTKLIKTEGLLRIINTKNGFSHHTSPDLSKVPLMIKENQYKKTDQNNFDKSKSVRLSYKNYNMLATSREKELKLVSPINNIYIDKKCLSSIQNVNVDKENKKDACIQSTHLLFDSLYSDANIAKGIRGMKEQQEYNDNHLLYRTESCPAAKENLIYQTGTKIQWNEIEPVYIKRKSISKPTPENIMNENKSTLQEANKVIKDEGFSLSVDSSPESIYYRKKINNRHEIESLQQKQDTTQSEDKTLSSLPTSKKSEPYYKSECFQIPSITIPKLASKPTELNLHNMMETCNVMENQTIAKRNEEKQITNNTTYYNIYKSYPKSLDLERSHFIKPSENSFSFYSPQIAKLSVLPKSEKNMQYSQVKHKKVQPESGQKTYMSCYSPEFNKTIFKNTTQKVKFPEENTFQNKDKLMGECDMQTTGHKNMLEMSSVNKNVNGINTGTAKLLEMALRNKMKDMLQNNRKKSNNGVHLKYYSDQNRKQNVIKMKKHVNAIKQNVTLKTQNDPLCLKLWLQNVSKKRKNGINNSGTNLTYNLQTVLEPEKLNDFSATDSTLNRCTMDNIKQPVLTFNRSKMKKTKAKEKKFYFEIPKQNISDIFFDSNFSTAFTDTFKILRENILNFVSRKSIMPLQNSKKAKPLYKIKHKKELLSHKHVPNVPKQDSLTNTLSKATINSYDLFQLNEKPNNKMKVHHTDFKRKSITVPYVSYKQIQETEPRIKKLKNIKENIDFIKFRRPELPRWKKKDSTKANVKRVSQKTKYQFSNFNNSLDRSTQKNPRSIWASTLNDVDTLSVSSQIVTPELALRVKEKKLKKRLEAFFKSALQTYPYSVGASPLRKTRQL